LKYRLLRMSIEEKGASFLKGKREGDEKPFWGEGKKEKAKENKYDCGRGEGKRDHRNAS